ncbi:MAG: AAA family ATPase [Spirochaetaceae bacterium]|nr:AAA family ATPase [Spirochaetaceae bacterium]
MISPKNKIASILKELNQGLFEKEEIVRLCLLASAAGENVFLLGPPGTAKSLVCRRLKYAFENASSFEYLINQFSTPDEIFGPVSIQKLKDEGKYERLTDGFLPKADFVFLDEIWKAGSAIANSILTVINEKIFRNGGVDEITPLKLLVSASNEPPKEEGLEALWDRFLIRVNVEGVKDVLAFKKMLNLKEISIDSAYVTNKIGAEEFDRWKKEISLVKLSDYVLDFLIKLKENINDYNTNLEDNKKIYISDRRWRKIAHIIKTSAHLNGRREANLVDCFLCEYCIWTRKEEIDKTKEILQKTMINDAIISSNDIQNIRREIYLLKNNIVELTIKTEDSRKTIAHKKGKYYSFMDAESGNELYIKQDDYYLLEYAAKECAVYKRIPVKTGYLNQNRNMLFKNGMDSFTSHGDDLELCCALERTASIKKTDDAFVIEVNGKSVKIHTITTGNKYRVTRSLTEKEKNIFDKKTSCFFNFLADMEEKLRRYEKKHGKETKNLFVKTEYSYFIDEHIRETKKELEKIKLEIHELQNFYLNIPDKKTVVA